MFADTFEDLPFMTADLPGIGGRIKVRYEDFVVEEMPLYTPSGEGGHCYLWVEKRGSTTPGMVHELARALKISPRKIGYAGRKDARAVTRQWISVEGVEPDGVAQLNLPKVTILEAANHANKLKIGHSRGNQFILKVRNVDCPLGEARERAEAIFDVLTRRGVPNYYGPQRFGIRYDSHLLGYAILTAQYERFIDMFLGLPDPDAELSVIYTARVFYEQGNYQKALESWPGQYHDQCRALKALVNSDGDKRKAYNILERHMKRFLVAALQSYLFNQTVAARMPDLDHLLPGDLAWKHDSGASFRVEDLASEQPRCDAFEISPSGPLLGPKMIAPEDAAGEIEQKVLDDYQFTQEYFKQMAAYRMRGGRRALRFRAENVQVAAGDDEHGDYIKIDFQLPPGCYATTVLREVTKCPDIS